MRLYYSPKEEIAEMFIGEKEKIFLKSATSYTKVSFQNEIMSRGKSLVTTTYTIPQIVKKWGESVVLVISMDENGNELNQGSGFVITKNGAIVTNYHVVELAHNVSIEFINGKSYCEAFLIAGYPYRDIAILHIEGEKWLSF